MRIDFESVKPHYLNFMQQRGCPEMVLQQRFKVQDYLKSIEVKTEGGFFRVKASAQLEAIEAIGDNPLQNFFLVIGSTTTERRAQAVAAYLFYRAIRQYRKYGTDSRRSAPLWHRLFGGYKDKIRDDKYYTENLGRPSFLVVDNLAANSTLEKVEKARDLLAMFESTPRILMVYGANPAQFVRDSLHVQPDRVVYIGERVIQA